MADRGFVDFPLARRSPFGAAAPSGGAAISLEAVTGCLVLQVLARAATTRETIVAAIGSASQGSLRFAGPGQWFLVADGDADRQDIADRLEGVAEVVDQSHGRACIRIGGGAVRAMLAKGTGVDLADEAFPLGHAAMTLVGHIGVNLARVGENVFEMLVLRGFAESLWHDLEVMSAEFR